MQRGTVVYGQRECRRRDSPQPELTRTNSADDPGRRFLSLTSVLDIKGHK